MSEMKKDYKFWVKFASTSAVIAALLMILVKVYAWHVTDSASILATLTDSVFDVMASVVNFFVIRYALTPADDDHRFGHGKAEALAGLMQAAFVIGSAILLLFHSVGRLSHPQPINNVDVGLYAIVFTIVITLILVMIQTLALRKANSVAIKADSLHYKGDLFMNLGVVFALLLSQWGYLTLDAWIAIGIAFYLLHGAYEIGSESLNSLMDKELPPEQHDNILSIAKNVDSVLGVHDLRTRQSGGTTFVQLHLELDDQLPLVQAHEIGDEVEQKILQYLPQAEVLVHLDPISVVNSKRDPVVFRD